MDCRRIEELIPLYVENDLGGQRASDVRTHLQSCAACRALADAYEASQAWLRAAEVPDFDEAFVDTIRAGVMTELLAHEAAPPFVERLRRWLVPRRLVAATAALLVIFIAVMLFVYASRSRGSRQDEQKAEQNKQPAVEKVEDDLKPAPEAKQVAKPPRRPASHRAASLLAGHAKRDAGRTARPQGHLVAQPPLQAATVAPSHDRNDVNKRAETLRIEIQTADPNIRIIWFAPKPTDAETPNPMGETL
jgi:cbb3-type cytochrome oxidase subunit 3